LLTWSVAGLLVVADPGQAVDVSSPKIAVEPFTAMGKRALVVQTPSIRFTGRTPVSINPPSLSRVVVVPTAKGMRFAGSTNASDDVRVDTRKKLFLASKSVVRAPSIRFERGMGFSEATGGASVHEVMVSDREGILFIGNGSGSQDTTRALSGEQNPHRAVEAGEPARVRLPWKRMLPMSSKEMVSPAIVTPRKK